MKQQPIPLPSVDPSFSELFTPKFATVLREGYGLANLRADAVAGLTVAIVALPLSMAIAIASGATPAQGLYTAIIGGFLVSAFGGSRFQIGGPAGAFIVLVSGTVAAHGMDGLILAVLLSGLIMIAGGFLGLGTFIKFIPYPVTVGFTAGIAAIIFASQIKDLFGLTLAAPEPGPMVEKLPALWVALPTVSATTVAIAGATILIIQGLKRWQPNRPGMLIAVIGTAVATWLFGLDIETIGSRFGGIPAGLPLPSMPALTLEKILAVLPNAFAFALLGAIESLLSAVVADGMTGRRHRSNCELVAQGIANVGSSLFAGMLHSFFLLLFILVAAPLASFIPLACLAGVLAVVAWNMIEKHAFVTLLRASRGDAAVLLVTFGLTVFRDLTEAIVVGFALGSVLFIYRVSQTTAVETHTPFVPVDKADDANGERAPYQEGMENDPDIIVYRISGAFFFGAAASVGSVLERIGDAHRVLIVDFSSVPFVDSTAAHTMESLVAKAARRGIAVYLSGTSAGVRNQLVLHHLKPPRVDYETSIVSAVSRARQDLKSREASGA